MAGNISLNIMVLLGVYKNYVNNSTIICYLILLLTSNPISHLAAYCYYRPKIINELH